MKKIQTILFFLFIALFWSCSLVEHDEEKGNIFVQLNSGTILSKLNSGSSRGDVSTSVQESFTARLIVTNGLSEIYSTSKVVSGNDNLTFSVAGLPVKTFVTVKMQIIGSSGTVYFEGSKDVFVLEGSTPVEIVLKSAGSGQEFVLNTKFKLCGTLYDGDEIKRFYDEGEAGILPLEDDVITFFFVPYETDLTSFDPEYSYVPADEWRWELNGNEFDDVVYNVNPCSVSLATPGLEYEKTNVLTCTVRIGEVWYQAVYKFTVEQPAAGGNYNSYAFYVENRTSDYGYISSYNLNNGFAVSGSEKQKIYSDPYRINVTADDGKTYLCYRENYDSEYTIKYSKNEPDMKDAAVNNSLRNYTFEDGDDTEINWLSDGNNANTGKINGRIAYDSVTKKYWMLGKYINTDHKSSFYMISTDSITENKGLQLYPLDSFIYDDDNADRPINMIFGYSGFAVYNNYVILEDEENNPKKLHILKVGNTELEYINYITLQNYIDNEILYEITFKDIQAVGSDIYLLYGAAINSYSDNDNHSYGFVAKLTYTGNEDEPYEYDSSFGTVGLTANYSNKTVIKMKDEYFTSSSSPSTPAQYFSYYGPTEKDADCSFFSPQYFAAIKDDYLYVIDDGFRKKEDSETGALANRDRLMKVSLKDKTVSVEKDGISLGPGNASMPDIFEF